MGRTAHFWTQGSIVTGGLFQMAAASVRMRARNDVGAVAGCLYADDVEDGPMRMEAEPSRPSTRSELRPKRRLGVKIAALAAVVAVPIAWSNLRSTPAKKGAVPKAGEAPTTRSASTTNVGPTSSLAVRSSRKLIPFPVEVTTSTKVGSSPTVAATLPTWKTWFGDAKVTQTLESVKAVKVRSEDVAAQLSIGPAVAVPGHRYRLSGVIAGSTKPFYGAVTYYDAKSKSVGQIPITARPGPKGTTLLDSVSEVPAGTVATILGMSTKGDVSWELASLALDDVTSAAELAAIPTTAATTTLPIPTTVGVVVLRDLPVRGTVKLVDGAKRKSGVDKWRSWYGDAKVTTLDSGLSVEPGESEDATVSVVLRSPAVVSGHTYQLVGKIEGGAAAIAGGTVQFYDAQARPVATAGTFVIANSLNPSIAWQGDAGNSAYALVGIYRRTTKPFVITELELRDVSTDEQVRLAALPATGPDSSGAAPAVTLATRPARSTVSLVGAKGPGVGLWKPWYGRSRVTAVNGEIALTAGSDDGEATAAVVLRAPAVVAGHGYQLIGSLEGSSDTSVRGGVVQFYDQTGRPSGTRGEVVALSDAKGAIGWEGTAPSGAAYAVVAVYGRGGTDWRIRRLELRDVTSATELAALPPPTVVTIPAPAPRPTTAATVPPSTINAKLTAISAVSLVQSKRALGVAEWARWYTDSTVKGRNDSISVKRGRKGDATASLVMRRPAITGGHTYQFVGRLSGPRPTVSGGSIVFYDGAFKPLTTYSFVANGDSIAWEGTAPPAARAAIIGLYRSNVAEFTVDSLALRDITSPEALTRLESIVDPLPSSVPVPVPGPSSSGETTPTRSVTTVTTVPPTLADLPVARETSLISGDGEGQGGWKTWFGDATVNAVSGEVVVSKKDDKSLSAYLALSAPLLRPGRGYQIVGQIEGPSGDGTGASVIFIDKDGKQIGVRADLSTVPVSPTELGILGQVVVPEGTEYALVGMFRSGVERWTLTKLLWRELAG
jgi:hypothetical protein